MKSQKQGPRSIEQIRGEIVTILTREAPDTLKSNELSKKLGIAATDPEYESVRDALEDLLETGEIFRGARRSYGVVVPETLIEGRLRMIRAGQWCIVPDDGPECEVGLDARHLWTALHGDRVVAKIIGVIGPGEIPQAEITRVVERKTDRIVGTLKKGREFFIDADDRKIHRTFNIHRNELGNARIGDKVLAKVHEWTDPFSDPVASIIEVIGRAGDMKAEIKSIALKHNLPFVFPDDVLEEAEGHPETIPDEVISQRRDLRDLDIFTIDPHDARDFDDAISIQEHPDGDVTLGIHIADVSHYVPEGSMLDDEAYRRGTSVYLVTGVIPMLPERLSNNLCSLRPDEDRLAYTVMVRLSPRGAIKEYEIFKSVIRSKRRFTYEDALVVLQTGEGDYAKELLAINRAAHIQRALRRRKGSVDFSSTELKFKLDENDFPVEVVQKTATESTKLIEDCMLLANRVVAEHIGNERSSKRGGAINPFVYRIHASPPKEKLLDLSNFVKQFGYSIPVDNVQPKDIQALIDAARGTDEEEMINEVALRSMAKAVYSEFNIGHFGLAFKHYSHFTSPIRRYPDLIVHRLLDEYATGMPNDRRVYYSGSLGSLTTHCSERERAAVEAERASIKIAEVQFLKRHVGDVFEGLVGGVMPFGLFVELKRYGIEGLAPVRNMRDDYYIYDERTKSLRGRANRKVYRLGDPVHIRVIRVDEISSQIDLAIIDQSEFLEEGGEEGNVGVEGNIGGAGATSGRRGSEGRGAGADDRQRRGGSSRGGGRGQRTDGSARGGDSGGGRGGRHDGGGKRGGKTHAEEGRKRDGGKRDAERPAIDKRDDGKRDVGRLEDSRLEDSRLEDSKRDVSKIEGARREGDERRDGRRDHSKRNNGKREGGRRDTGKRVDAGREDNRRDEGRRDDSKRDDGTREGGRPEGGKREIPTQGRDQTPRQGDAVKPRRAESGRERVQESDGGRERGGNREKGRTREEESRPRTTDVAAETRPAESAGESTRKSETAPTGRKQTLRERDAVRVSAANRARDARGGDVSSERDAVSRDVAGAPDAAAREDAERKATGGRRGSGEGKSARKRSGGGDAKAGGARKSAGTRKGGGAVSDGGKGAKKGGAGGSKRRGR